MSGRPLDSSRHRDGGPDDATPGARWRGFAGPDARKVYVLPVHARREILAMIRLSDAAAPGDYYAMVSVLGRALERASELAVPEEKLNATGA